MNKKLIFSILPVYLWAFCLVFVSCGDASTKLVGKWTSETTPGTGTVLVHIIEFSEDGTGRWDGAEIQWSIDNDKNNCFVISKELLRYNCKISGKKITVAYNNERGTVYKKMN
jgi:hypothetical protein